MNPNLINGSMEKVLRGLHLRPGHYTSIKLEARAVFNRAGRRIHEEEDISPLYTAQHPPIAQIKQVNTGYNTVSSFQLWHLVANLPLLNDLTVSWRHNDFMGDSLLWHLNNRCILNRLSLVINVIDGNIIPLTLNQLCELPLKSLTLVMDAGVTASQLQALIDSKINTIKLTLVQDTAEHLMDVVFNNERDLAFQQGKHITIQHTHLVAPTRLANETLPAPKDNEYQLWNNMIKKAKEGHVTLNITAMPLDPDLADETSAPSPRPSSFTPLLNAEANQEKGKKNTSESSENNTSRKRRKF